MLQFIFYAFFQRDLFQVVELLVADLGQQQEGLIEAGKFFDGGKGAADDFALMIGQVFVLDEHFQFGADDGQGGLEFMGSVFREFFQQQVVFFCFPGGHAQALVHKGEFFRRGGGEMQVFGMPKLKMLHGVQGIVKGCHSRRSRMRLVRRKARMVMRMVARETSRMARERWCSPSRGLAIVTLYK